MKSNIAVLLIAASILSAPAALAQIKCTPTVRTVEPISVAGKNEDFFTGLAGSMILALTPNSLPYANVVRQADTCTRGEFQANGATFRIYGAPPDSPPRWAVGEDKRKIAYIALGPPPDVGLAWAKSRAAGHNDPVMFKSDALYILAVTNGDTRDIFGLFSEVPGDDQLMTLFKGALDGSLPKIATFDETSRKTEFAAR